MSQRTRLYIVAGLVLALAFGGLAYTFRPRPAQPVAGEPGEAPEQPEPAVADLVLQPASASRAGVDPDSHFILESTQPLEPQVVAKSLNIMPKVEFQVDKADPPGNKYVIRPARSLAPNQVYRFTMQLPGAPERPFSWAFQTRAAFRVRGTLPRHQASGVPANTGIEIHFSHENFGDPAGFFAISPEVPGRFERHKQTLVFVPQEPLAPGTVYTVTLRQGLPLTGTDEALAEDVVFSFETAPDSASQSQPGFWLHGDMPEYATDQVPYFTGQSEKVSRLAVQVYRYPDAQAYAAAIRRADEIPDWAGWSRSRYREDTGALGQVAAFDAEIQKDPNVWYGVVLFPEPLPAGYYLAEFAAAGQTQQLRFQVTDLASYLSVSETDTLVWLQDLQGGGPAAGAAVQVLGGGGGPWRAGSDGVATFATPRTYVGDQREPLFLLATHGGMESVIYAPRHWWPFHQLQDRTLNYWRYLYLDRPLYRPGDTVHFWGVIRPRERDAEPLSEVTAEVVRSYWGEYESVDMVLAATAVPVQNGSLTGHLALPNLRPGWYTLRLRSGDTVMSVSGFEVQTYTKPSYRVEVSTDHRAIFYDESTTFRVRAAFFEGTPVQGLSLNYSLAGREGKLETGETGEAAVEFRPRSAGGRLSISDYHSIYIQSSLPEAGEISAQAAVQVFGSRVYLQSKGYEIQDGMAGVTFQVNAVDLGPLNTGNPWDSFIADPVPGATVTGTLWERHWEKIREGEYYDFINKEVRQRYRYEYRPIRLDTVSATTGADGRAVVRFPVDPKKEYKLEMEVKDAAGRPHGVDTYVYGTQYQGRDEEYQYYHLAFADPARWQFHLDEPVELTMKVNDAPVPDRTGGFLFFTARRGIRQHRVQDAGLFRTALREPDLPQFTVYGVYFDGRRFRAEAQQSVRFDPARRRLNVAITPDQPAYRPQDTVRLQVQVTDDDGRPARATVNLNLVDEALFALAGQHVNLLERLYGDWIPSGVLRTRWSHRSPDTGGGAEKGEGGGERSDFRDAIFFETVTTDAAGRAEVQFKVPDNLTSWRVTYQAVTDRLEAGSGTLGIPVKLPFFLELVLNEAYLAGDQPVLSARAYGEQLKRDQPVEMTAEITDPAGNRTELTRTGAAFQMVEIPLPRLAAGEYTVRVTAKGPGGLTDIVRRTFRAEESFLRRTLTGHYLLSESTRITGAADGLTFVTFTDRLRGTYLATLRRLQWQGGRRLEFGLAARLARELGRAHFGDPELPGETVDPLRYQLENGGMAILPYADADLYLSAQVAAVCADCVDRIALSRYFYQVLDEKDGGRDRAITALYGLAALGEPVLLQVQELLRQTDLTRDEQLLAALAAAELGDHEPARALYRRLVRSHGEPLGSAWRLRVDGDADATLAATARAAALAAILGEPEEVGFLEYLQDHQSEELLVLLEQVRALQAGLPRMDGAPVAFTYVLDGKTERRELKDGGELRLAMTPEQLAGLQFRGIEGEVAAVVTYDGPFTLPAAGAQQDATLQRIYENLGGAGDWKPGDLVRIHLSYSLAALAPNGQYQVADFLPAGLKPVLNPWQMGKWEENLGYPIEVSGQRVIFVPWRTSGELIYYARVVSTGEYLAENAILQHVRSGEVRAATGRHTVQIR